MTQKGANEFSQDFLGGLDVIGNHWRQRRQCRWRCWHWCRYCC